MTRLVAACAMVAIVAITAHAQSTITIMPLGDSITQGNTTHDSFRRGLWYLLNDNGFDVDFVGSLSTNFGGPNPNPDFDLDHEGHWGWPADQILSNLPTFLAANIPDIVLVHLGSNDIRLNQSNATTIDELGQIIDACRVANPGIVVLLAQITPGEHINNANFETDVIALNALIPGLAASKTTAQSPVLVVDQHTGFTIAADTYDGLHPNPQGEQKMAQAWYNALVPVLDPSLGTPLPLRWWPLLAGLLAIGTFWVPRRNKMAPCR